MSERQTQQGLGKLTLENAGKYEKESLHNKGGETIGTVSEGFQCYGQGVVIARDGIKIVGKSGETDIVQTSRMIR